MDLGVVGRSAEHRHWIGHANMAYTLSIYTHRSSGLDRPAAKKVADVIFGDDWEAPTTEGA